MGDAPNGPSRGRVAAFVAAAIVVVAVIAGFAATADSGSAPTATATGDGSRTTVTGRGSVDPNAPPTTARDGSGPGSNGAGSASDSTAPGATNAAGGAPTSAASGSEPVTVTTKPGGLLRVPSLVGSAQNAATASLEKLGFAVSTVIESSTVPGGVVLRTAPEADVSAAKGTKVTLFVSRGDLVDVPVWSGLASSTKNIDQIRAQAGASGLRVDFAGPSSCNPSGQFIAQSPAGGAQVPRGTLVVLTAQCP